MKRINLYKLIVTVVATLFMSAGAYSANSVKARLDSATMMMGSVRTLQLTVEQGAGQKGHLPIFNNIAEKGYVSVCGDSVELRAPVKIDTVKNNNSLTLKYDIPVQCFDSGYYHLPEIEFVIGVDTLRSNKVALKVLPVPNVTAETPIADYANVADPEDKSIFDSIPDWLYNYWWILIILILAAGTGYYLWKRYRSTGAILPKKPEPTPYESAIAALKELKEKKLWENGMEKEYFTTLTDILRTYLFRRFGINAMEMTSRQILSALSANKETKDQRPMIRQILDMADFVKFAKVRPLPADNIQSFDNAVKFVEDTKVIPEPEPAESENDSSSKKGNKNDEKKVKDSLKSKKGGER
ncbi:MAG: DUF4381 domain-containing protein [Muribaculaceae bacterium]|nr:DUF4381 domain-containing protein [Muribaculaceae bacterium]